MAQDIPTLETLKLPRANTRTMLGPKNFSIESGMNSARSTSPTSESGDSQVNETPRLMSWRKTIIDSYGDSALILMRRNVCALGSDGLAEAAALLERNIKSMAVVMLNLGTQPIGKKFFDYYFSVSVKEQTPTSFFYCSDNKEFAQTLAALAFLGDKSDKIQPFSRVSFLFFHESRASTVLTPEQRGHLKDNLLSLKQLKIVSGSFRDRNLLISAPLIILNSDQDLRTQLVSHGGAIQVYGEAESKVGNASYEHSKSLIRFMTGSTILWIGKSFRDKDGETSSSEKSAASRALAKSGPPRLLASSSGEMSSVSKFGVRAFVKEARLKAVCITFCKDGSEALEYIKNNPHQLLNTRFRMMIDNRTPSDETRKLVETLRARYLFPVLVVGLENLNAQFYASCRIQVTTDFETIQRYLDTLTSLKWAPPLIYGSMRLPWEGTISITNVSCKNFSGKSDVNLVFRNGKQKFKTPHFSKASQDNNWKDLQWSLQTTSSDSIIVEVKSTSHSTTLQQEVLGETTIPLGHLLGIVPGVDPQIQHSVYIVSKKKNVPLGIITFQMSFSLQPVEPEVVCSERKYFGKSLTEAVQYCTSIGTDHIAVTLMNFLYKHALDQEGLIRVPGNKTRIVELRDEFDGPQGVSITFKRLQMESPYDIAGLVKLYLYELPDCLITAEGYEKLNSLDYESTTSELISNIREILHTIPEVNYELFSEVNFLFASLILRKKTTLLDAKAVGVSIGPTILLSPAVRNDPVAFLSASNRSGFILQCIIENAPEIFGWESLPELSYLETHPPSPKFTHECTVVDEITINTPSYSTLGSISEDGSCSGSHTTPSKKSDGIPSRDKSTSRSKSAGRKSSVDSADPTTQGSDRVRSRTSLGSFGSRSEGSGERSSLLPMPLRKSSQPNSPTKGVIHARRKTTDSSDTTRS